MRRFNLLAAGYEYPADNPEGYRRGHARVGEAIGSRRIGGTVYELPPGESAWPYHYELGDEEWLIVLDGGVAVRTPAGEEELGRGDVVCFPEGPEGAHKMVNRGASDDGRFWGPIPVDWVIGGAFATYWPPKRIGIL